jgi:antitoxin VapB
MTTAKLFANGRSQAVRLPYECRFKGKEVYINRIGNMVILLSKNDPWHGLIKSLGEFSADFMKKRVQPRLQKRKIT